MMLTPWGPSAVPTGGAGVALPAGICNLTIPVTFFAILTPLMPPPLLAGLVSVLIPEQPRRYRRAVFVNAAVRRGFVNTAVRRGAVSSTPPYGAARFRQHRRPARCGAVSSTPF